MTRRTCADCAFCNERVGLLKSTTVCLAPARDGGRVSEGDAACGDFVPRAKTAVGALFGMPAIARGEVPAVAAAPAPAAPAPAPTRGPRISCDVHTHTIFSRHAYSTVAEDVAAAAEAGMEVLGVTDHYSAMLYNDYTIQNYQNFLNLKCWPRTWHGVHLLRGCEADIVDLDGHLFGWDLPAMREITGQKMPVDKMGMLKDRAFADCDYVIASLHNPRLASTDPAANTRMYVGALDDPKVLILGHIGRSDVPLEIDALLAAARDRNKLVEINEHSLLGVNRESSYPRCRKIAERAAELGCMVSFGSDAHVCYDVGRHSMVSELLDEIHFPEELMACRDARTFLSLLPE